MWLLACVFSLCVGAWALHESDVGVVDWYKEFIGVPLYGSISTSPSFHRAGNRSFIVAATSSNVLAALEPEDGSILWRFIFNPEDRIAGYFKNESVIATLSGSGGSTLRTFNATNGQLLYEKRIHPPETGTISEPVYIGKDVVFSHDSEDLYVLSNGHTVSAIDGNTGHFKWRWTASDRGSRIIHTKLVLTTDTIYAIGVAKTGAASHTLHVTTLNTSTGKVIHSANIGANIADPWKESATVLNPSLQLPVAIWLEKGTLRYVPLTPTLNGKPKSVRGSGFVRIVDVGVGSRGQIVAVRQDGLGVIYQLEGEQTNATVVWEYEDAPFAKKNSESFYTAAFDENGHAYVGRVFWSHSIQRGSTDVFAAHIALGQSTGSVFPYDIKKYGLIQNVALDSGNPYEWTVKSRLLLVTSTGVLQFWDADEVKWIREEALANVSAAEVVEIPPSVISETSQGDGASETFLTRIRRQISDAKDFPQYAINFVNRFTGGSLPISSTQTNNTVTGLSRDQFGFRQVIVAATKLGKIYGIDSSNGEIIWSRVLSYGWAESVGAQVIPVKIYTIKTVSDGGDPEVVLVTQRRADNGLVDTVIFHVDAMTGRDITGHSKDKLKIEGQDIISGSLVDSFFLDHDQKMVVLLDEFLQVYLYPDTVKTQSTFQNLIPKLSFPLRTKGEQRARVVGHQISPSDNPAFRPVAHPTWSLTLQPSESIQSLIPPASRGPIASFGKVLGNRTTLYKYLNPRLFIVLTSIPEKAKCGLYVVDSMKGTVLYRVEVDATSSARGCEVRAVLVENWLVFHYYENGIGDGGAKGFRVVSVEFYEGQGIDEKTKSIELSAFHNETLNFHTYEQAYILSNGITAMASTTTRFGISNKDLIVATKDHKIQQLPRVLLNPRRPKRKPTAEEQEEFLIEYDPVLPHDPKRVLSHNYKVANVQNILTSPSLLESTTLIYSYGLDMFLTRLAPSGTFDILSETFNKMQLVFTVLGLFVAVLVTKPMVRRKQLREKWYQ